MSSYTGGEVSVCDSLSGGSLSDSLSVQLVELYRPAIQNGMVMMTLLPVQQQEGTLWTLLHYKTLCCNGQQPPQH